MAQNTCIDCGESHNEEICPCCGSEDFTCDETWDDIDSDYETEEDFEDD